MNLFDFSKSFKPKISFTFMDGSYRSRSFKSICLYMTIKRLYVFCIWNKHKTSNKVSSYNTTHIKLYKWPELIKILLIMTLLHLHECVKKTKNNVHTAVSFLFFFLSFIVGRKAQQTNSIGNRLHAVVNSCFFIFYELLVLTIQRHLLPH